MEVKQLFRRAMISRTWMVSECISMLLFMTAATAAQEQPDDVDWRAAYQAGNLLFSTRSRNQSYPWSLRWPSVGNGFLGTIANSDTVRIQGVFGAGQGELWSVRSRVPSWSAVRIEAGSSRNHRYALDMVHAEFLERFSTLEGCEVERRIWAHRSRPSLIITEVQVHARALSCVLNIASAAGPTDNSTDNSTLPFQPTTMPNSSTKAAQCMQGKPPVEKGLSPRKLPAPTVAVCFTPPPLQLLAAPGSTTSLKLVAAHATSFEAADPVLKASNELDSAMVASIDALRNEHRTAWKTLWQDGGIEIASIDQELVQTVNSSMYYLLSSFRRDWLHGGLAPTALGYNYNYPTGYSGGYFFDGDNFQAPSLLLLHQPLIRNLLNWRLSQLDGYKHYAKDLGIAGAFLPMEVGAEEGPSVNPVSGDRWHPANMNLFKTEIQTGGFVTHLFRQYWQQTHDLEFLNTTYPFVSAVVDFYVARVNSTSPSGNLLMHDLTCTIEIAHPASNCAAMAVSARLAAEFALSMARTLRVTLDSDRQARWEKLSTKLLVPFNSSDGGWHPAWSEYHDGMPVTQAAVEMINFPFQVQMSSKVKRNDLLMYEKNYKPGGCDGMYYGFHVVGWLDRDVRNLTHADNYLYRSMGRTVDSGCTGPWRVWRENPDNVDPYSRPGGAVNFMTGAGTFLQGLVFGYGGMRFGEDAMRWDPVLPHNVSSMKLRGVDYMGCSIDMLIQSAGAEVSISAPCESPELLVSFANGSATVIRPEVAVWVPSQALPFTIGPVHRIIV